MENVTVEIDADGLYAIKIGTQTFEVNIRLPRSDAARLATAAAGHWAGGAMRIGESAGAPVYWCNGENGGISIMIGHDDESWDIGLEISRPTFEAILTELATLSSNGGPTLVSATRPEMIVSLARIEGRNITDWATFHDEFTRVFGFPDSYGRNMNALIDCMTSLDAEQDGMTSIHVPPGAVLGLEV